MAKKTINWYTLDNIKKMKARYNMILGPNGNGKSFAVKMEILKDAIIYDKKFMYMRRYTLDLKEDYIYDYLADMVNEGHIKQLTNGEWTDVYVRKKKIYLCRYEEDGSCTLGPHIGSAFAISEYGRYKSQVLYFHNMVIEEFLTATELYLPNEPSLLQRWVAIPGRYDDDFTIYLIGNTMTKVCPYFTDWGLDKVPDMVPGQLDLYHFESSDYNEDGTRDIITIAVEMSKESGKKKTAFFGHVGDNIVHGEWTVQECPILPGSEKDYYVYHQILFQDLGQEFLLQLLFDKDNGVPILYVKPYENEKVKRIITSKFSSNPLTTVSFSDKIRAEVKMRELMRENKICYHDNAIGTSFLQVVEQRKGGPTDI